MIERVDRILTTPPTEDQVSDAFAPSSPALSGQDLLLWSALPDLTLNIAQTAALCGVSVRQLGYWTKQGYVTAAGKGARRLYGPTSLRRILSIRQAMINGLTLRQALRAVDESASAAFALPMGHHRGAPEADSASPGALLAADVETVSADLLTLMQRNRETRDSADGLSAKLGRTQSHVRQAADYLTARGTLHKFISGSDAVYCLADRRLA